MLLRTATHNDRRFGMVHGPCAKLCGVLASESWASGGALGRSQCTTRGSSCKSQKRQTSVRWPASCTDPVHVMFARDTSDGSPRSRSTLLYFPCQPRGAPYIQGLKATIPEGSERLSRKLTRTSLTLAILVIVALPSFASHLTMSRVYQR